MTTPLSGLTWAGDTVTWAFATTASAAGVTDAITDPTQQAAVSNGIQEWAQVSGVHLQQVSDPSQADIQVGYGNLSGLGESSWSYNPQTDEYTNATVLLEDPAIRPLAADSSGNLTYSGSDAWLQQLAAHEAGAVLGLAEDSDPTSIMNHVQTNTNRTPNAADVAAIDSLYGPPASNAAPAAGATPATVSADTLTHQLSKGRGPGKAPFIANTGG